MTNLNTYGAVTEQIERLQIVKSATTNLDIHRIFTEQLEIYRSKNFLLRLLSVVLWIIRKKVLQVKKGGLPMCTIGGALF